MNVIMMEPQLHFLLYMAQDKVQEPISSFTTPCGNQTWGNVQQGLENSIICGARHKTAAQICACLGVDTFCVTNNIMQALVLYRSSKGP
jgi:hypothetical protein